MAAAFRFGGGREAGPTAHTSRPQREIPSARSIHPPIPESRGELRNDAWMPTRARSRPHRIIASWDVSGWNVPFPVHDPQPRDSDTLALGTGTGDLNGPCPQLLH